jgi:hypothetical protein
MDETCMVPKDLAVNSSNKLEYILCGEPASYLIGDWYVCEKCRATYPKSWPTTLLEGAD